MEGQKEGRVGEDPGAAGELNWGGSIMAADGHFSAVGPSTKRRKITKHKRVTARHITDAAVASWWC